MLLYDIWRPLGPKRGGRYERDGGQVKGDTVEIVVDVSDGTKTYVIAASKAGRRVEISTSRGAVEVSEVTRTGIVIRTGRFMSTRVVALIEHPAEGPDRAEPRAENQASLL